MRKGAEERDSVSDENWDASDDEAVNESCAQEVLNCDSAIDVEVLGAGGGEARDDFGGRAGHLFDFSSGYCGEVERTAAEDDYALLTVRPRGHGQNGVERFAAHHNGIDGSDELIVAVRFAAARRKEVELAVLPRDEAIKAGADKDGDFHLSGAEA